MASSFIVCAVSRELSTCILCVNVIEVVSGNGNARGITIAVRHMSMCELPTLVLGNSLMSLMCCYRVVCLSYGGGSLQYYYIRLW